MNTALLYKDKAIFGLDIGFNSLKVMQIEDVGKSKVIIGYGVTSFDSSFVNEGVILRPDELAKVAFDLFNKKIVGEITTRRVALAVPSVRTFNRTIQLPKMNRKELDAAIRMEAEQYIPMPLSELYLDHEVISTSADEVELLIVATPRKIIESYIQFAELLGLEVVAIETTIAASSRLFQRTEASDTPTVLIDYGSVSSDITIFDKTLVVTGTVPGGGDNFTKLIATKLDVNHQEAHIIKTKYGLGVSKKQKEITESISPLLDQLTKEIRRMIRYYEERSGTERKISQVVTMGGGANMPGLSEYMTSHLRLPVRMCAPWQMLSFKDLQPPSTLEKSMYITVAGLALMQASEVTS